MTVEPPALERKLAAILNADVEGYSRLMGDDEAATVRTRAAYGEVIAGLVSRHRGRVVDFTGDNLLAEFASVVDAVTGAVEIQRELAARNDELPDHRKMRFRIGISLRQGLAAGRWALQSNVNPSSPRARTRDRPRRRTPPGRVEAQRQIPRIGYLVVSPLVDPPTAERQAFLDGLRELGYVEGQTIVIEYRSAKWNRELLPDLAAELVDLKVDLIVAVGNGVVEAARQTTTTIPIVAAAVGDPVELGFVASLGRPGGNITGTAWSPKEAAGKRLQLLKEAVVRVSRVAVL